MIKKASLSFLTACLAVASCSSTPARKYAGTGDQTTVTEMRVFALSSCPVTDPNPEAALLAGLGTAAAGAVANLVVDWVSKGISSAKEKSKGTYDSGKVFTNSTGFYKADADKPTMKDFCIVVAHATYGPPALAKEKCTKHVVSPDARNKQAECDRILDANVWAAASEAWTAEIKKDQATELAEAKLYLATVKQEFTKRKAQLTAVVDASAFGFSRCKAINDQAVNDEFFSKKRNYFSNACPVVPPSEIVSEPKVFSDNVDLVPFTVILQATWTKDANVFLNALDKAVSENKAKWEASIKDRLAYELDSDYREKKQDEEEVSDLTQKIALIDAIDKANKQGEIWKESASDGKSAPSTVLGNQQLYEKLQREANLAHLKAGEPLPFPDVDK